MSEKTKSKAALLEMLAEAVRNTQPQPIASTQREAVREPQPKLKRKTQYRKMRPATKRTAEIKNVRASASRKRRRR